MKRVLEKIHGIITKTQDYGETHKIVTLFSKELGKFSAIARGAKKTNSRMAAVTQPFIYGQFFVYISSGLSTIQQGEIIYSFRSIREDLLKTANAAYITELTDKLVEPKKADVFLFDQLYQTMCWIEEKEEADVPMMMYELKLFAAGGFSPTVHHCVNCGSKTQPFSFSISEGGFLCNRCAHLDSRAILLPNAVARLLYLFLHVGLERVGNISVKVENKRLIKKILEAYYDQYGGYYLKSKKFLDQLKRLE